MASRARAPATCVAAASAALARVASHCGRYARELLVRELAAHRERERPVAPEHDVHAVVVAEAERLGGAAGAREVDRQAHAIGILVHDLARRALRAGEQAPAQRLEAELGE